MADDTTETPTELIPLRMLNEFAYCPRLFHLMHVEARWADNVYTIEGKHAHRRVDALDHVLPDAPGVPTSVGTDTTEKRSPSTTSQRLPGASQRHPITRPRRPTRSPRTRLRRSPGRSPCRRIF